MALMVNDEQYRSLVDAVRRDISTTRTRSVRMVNSEVICMYWRIGSSINGHAEWGSRFIDSLSTDIRTAFPGIKGFSVRYLKYMAKFARETDERTVQTLFAQLSWSHSIALMEGAS